MLKILALSLFVFSSLFAIDSKAVKVADGDTVTILTDSKEQVKIRLFGIDAPESLLLVKE